MHLLLGCRNKNRPEILLVATRSDTHANGPKLQWDQDRPRLSQKRVKMGRAFMLMRAGLFRNLRK